MGLGTPDQTHAIIGYPGVLQPCPVMLPTMHVTFAMVPSHANCRVIQAVPSTG
jgi:hypothetical protein